LVVKPCADWTSIYSSAPILHVALLRNIARAAGCHICSDANDVVFANRRFVAVYSPNGGHRVLRITRAGRIYDVLTGRVLAADGQQVSLTILPNTTTLLGID
jgi:hypothetical protein